MVQLGVEWCIMKQTAATEKNLDNGRDVLRASISFPGDTYRAIESLAREKKVSVAWIVRRAVDQYLGAEWPLLYSEAAGR